MNARVVGGVAAVALMAAGYLWMTSSLDATRLPSHAPEVVDAQLQREGVEIFRIAKQQFPEDYGAMIHALSAARAAGGSEGDIAQLTQEAMTNLRRTHADAALAASDTRLREIVGMSRELHGKVREAEGRTACNGFAIAGPGALGPSLIAYLDRLDRQGAAVLQAIAEGRSRETKVTAPTAEDWDAARAQALADGASPELMAALTTLDRENGDLCAGLIALMDAFMAMDDSAGQRLRAGYVRDLARN